jgi:hypothetical protein
MSLKAFHLIFITASSALAIGCGIWALQIGFSPEGGALDFVVGVGSVAAGLGLIWYERYFLKKTRNLSYL